MQVRWYGQSALTLTTGSATVTTDPFADCPATPGRDLHWGYAPVPAHDADLLLVTHEHADHNCVHVVGGDPDTVPARRPAASRHPSARWSQSRRSTIAGGAGHPAVSGG